MSHYVVVHNTGAGSGTGLEAIQQALLAGGLSRVTYIAIGPRFASQVRQAVASGGQVLVAAGGDGTVNAVANLAVELKLPLAVLPVGTLNHFAVDLGVGQSLAAAVATLAAGERRQIDVARMNQRIFVNNSSIGLYPALVRQRERLQPYLTKWPAMAVAFVLVLGRIKRHGIEAEIDGQPTRIRASFVFVGNNRYQIEHGELTKRAGLDEGLLSLYILKTAKLHRLLRVAWRGVRGQLADERAFTILQAKNVKLRFRYRRVSVAMDGEVAHEKPLVKYQILPKALTVIAPATSRAKVG